jgi:hypothetical protein
MESATGCGVRENIFGIGEYSSIGGVSHTAGTKS